MMRRTGIRKEEVDVMSAPSGLEVDCIDSSANSTDIGSDLRCTVKGEINKIFRGP
jgi:hypothetical protein